MKRVVCLLLVPAVLLTQWVGQGHSHCGSQPAGHALRPHFHTNLISPHNHLHAPDRHSRHHDADEPAELDEPADHDSDAVYIGDVVAVLRSDTAGDSIRAASHAAEPGLPAASAIDPPGLSAGHGRPPPFAATASRPLFLRYLALLL